MDTKAKVGKLQDRRIEAEWETEPVREYERWLARGSRLRDIPEIPSDADYGIARAAGKARRGLSAGPVL